MGFWVLVINAFLMKFDPKKKIGIVYENFPISKYNFPNLKSEFGENFATFNNFLVLGQIFTMFL